MTSIIGEGTKPPTLSTQGLIICSATTSPGSWVNTSQYGFNLGEQYTKKLSTWGILSLGYNTELVAKRNLPVPKCWNSPGCCRRR